MNYLVPMGGVIWVRFSTSAQVTHGQYWIYNWGRNPMEARSFSSWIPNSASHWAQGASPGPYGHSMGAQPHTYRLRFLCLSNKTQYTLSTEFVVLFATWKKILTSLQGLPTPQGCTRISRPCGCPMPELSWGPSTTQILHAEKETLIYKFHTTYMATLAP